MADLADVINPKKPLTEREEAAMNGPKAASAPASDYAKKFSKPFTEEEKKKQAEARIKALRAHEAKD
jgi:hypothetical protein